MIGFNLGSLLKHLKILFFFRNNINNKLGRLRIRVLSLNKALLEKGVPLETGYRGEVWGRTWRLVLSCWQKGLWCWLVEGAKRRLGSL